MAVNVLKRLLKCTDVCSSNCASQWGAFLRQALILRSCWLPKFGIWANQEILGKALALQQKSW